MADKNKNNNMDIALDEKIAQGVYSNLVLINHSSSEFVMDFIQVMPGVPKGQVRSRIILSPEHAKRFMFAMGNNIEKYENSFGDIAFPEDDGMDVNANIPINFGPPGEA